MDKLNSLRAFCIVAETHRFRTAAEKMGVSPAMASKYVSELEISLGVRLLNRNSRHVVLTDAGKQYFNNAKTIIDQLDNLDANISNTSRAISGKIRISAPVWLTNSKFSRFLKDFTNAYPDINLEIDLSGRNVNLIEEEYDLALRVSLNLSSELIAKKAFNINFGVYASPEYIENNADLINVENLGQNKFLSYNLHEKFEQKLEKATGIKLNASVSPIIISENEILLKLAAVEGIGIVLLPDMIVQNEISDGKLKRILQNEINVNVPMYIVYSNRHLLQTKIRAFIDFLSNYKFND